MTSRQIETGRADPEPHWDGAEAYVDDREGLVFWDTRKAMEAGRDKYPDYRHIGPEWEEREAGN